MPVSIAEVTKVVEVDDQVSARSVARRDVNGDLYTNVFRATQGVRSGGHTFVKRVTKTSAYTLAATETVAYGDATSAAFALGLPAASTVEGQLYFVEKIDESANAVTVDPAGADTIDGLSEWVLYNKGDAICLHSDGTRWHVLACRATLAIIAKTASFTIGSQPTPTLYLCDATAGAIVATAPPAADIKGIDIRVKKTDAGVNTVTIEPNAAETIDGDANLALDAENEVCRFTSDGANLQAT